ncbi:MAG: hypothetical protein QOH73_2435 [Gaiellaceae bacterium]|jgi:hypothetical protein|nr:hypothetical protein [Gaiellaceae bacterium]
MSRRTTRIVVLLLALFAAVSVWNAVTFPVGIGYDEAAHQAYANGLIHHGVFPKRLPPPAGYGNEYWVPPGFHATAGAVSAIGQALGMDNPWKLGRSLNVLWALATAALVFLIARRIFPGRERAQIATLGFFVFLPVVSRMTAMFHPELLSLFCGTLALYFTVEMLARRAFGFRLAAATGASLGAAQLVRSNTIWIFVAVVMTLLVLAKLTPAVRRSVLTATAVVVAFTALVSGPWYIRQTIEFSSPIPLQRQPPDTPLWENRPLSFYVGLGFPDVVRNPLRPSFVNEAIPTVYSDIWGDYFGYFAWTTDQSSATPAPATGNVHRQLVLQQFVGLVPTVLALAGWLLLWGRLRSRRALAEEPELLLVALVPLLGMLGFLYFSVKYPSGDGDVLKAAYLLTTAPAWALAFGAAVDRTIHTRRAEVVAAGFFAVAAAIDLVFLLYRGHSSLGV